MPRAVTKQDVVERLHNHPLQNYALISNVAKGIALGVGGLVLLEIISRLQTEWLRLLPWTASMALVLLSYMKWNRGILVSNARTNVRDSLFPFLMGVVEFLLFGVLGIGKDVSSFVWLNWPACVAGHSFTAAAIVHNRIRLAVTRDFDDAMAPLRTEYAGWLAADRLQSACVGTIATAVWILNLLWIIPVYGTKISAYVVCGFALVIALGVCRPISDANRERNRIDQLGTSGLASGPVSVGNCPVGQIEGRLSMTNPSAAPKDSHGILKIQDYLEASRDATKRTRRVLLTMVVASVIASIGVLNSLQSSWQQARVLKYKTPNDSYIVSLIGVMPAASAENDMKLYQARYQQMFASVARSYADTTSIQVPFFGVGIDINDLGVLSGFSLIIILVWFRLCVGIEIENLNLSFAESRELGQLPDLYQLLAMRQVMINPRVPGRIRRVFYWLVPLFLCILPAAAFTSVLVTDFFTKDVGYQLGLNTHTNIIVGADFVFTAAIYWLTVQAFLRWLRLDHAWTWYWCEYLMATEVVGRTSVAQNNGVSLAKRLEEALKEPLGKLRKKKIEEAVLLQLTGVDEGNLKVYKYVSKSVVLTMKLDPKGRLVLSQVTDVNAPIANSDELVRPAQASQ